MAGSEQNDMNKTELLVVMSKAWLKLAFLMATNDNWKCTLDN